jgi:tetratricopeptide (TPR) repeat protein
LTTDKVEAEGESNLFAGVDDLTRRIRSGFEIPSDQVFRPLEEVTTSSPQAYRFVVEGRKLFRQGKFEAAIALYEKAIEVDPEFAEALRELSAAHYNLSNNKESETYARRALALGDRLAPYLRYRLEFRLYSLHEEDYALAIEAQKKRLATDPRATPQNLANRYRYLERAREAVEVWEEFRRRGGDPGTVSAYAGLSHAYMLLGEYEQADRVLQEGMRRYPESAALYRFIGLLHLYRDRFDEALESFAKEQYPHLDRCEVFILREQWEEAADEAQKVTKSQGVARQSRGCGFQAIIHLYRGQSQKALTFLRRASEAFEEPDERGAFAVSSAGHVLLETGRLEEAMAMAQRAQRDGVGNIPEWEGLFLEAVAQARLGRFEEAEATAERLQQRTDPIPTEKEKRRHHHLMGELALIRGDFPAAIEELEKAESMLLVHGGGISPVFPYRHGNAQHVPIWYSLASAYLAAGDGDKAAEWFRRITETTVDRTVWPIPYVRSFYFLGKAHDNRGDMEKAREYYRRFYEYWKDGDMDRERVEEAKSKLGMT